MPNILQSLARASLNRSTLAAAAAFLSLLLPCSLLHAAEVEFKDVKINYTGAEVSWPDGSSGDIVFKFTDTASVGSLTLPSYAKAWILSVGGGGSGGSVAQNTTANGMGGGGGAGGFVEYPPEVIPGGTYSITVGKGGPKGTDTAGTLAAGNAGTASKISTNGVEIAKYTAQGGGGGGAESAGGNGASGGGGSMAGGATLSGGTGIGEQGSAGGDGSFAKSAGGGGGAGEPGDPPSKSGVSGAGGDGNPSAITCAAGAESVYYAGGGSAGVPTGVVPDAGLGGGGSGGGGKNGTAYVVGDGVNGLGGGGGGGNHKQIGGKGGDGVVIIRLSLALAGDPVKPVAPEGLRYTGENIVGVQPSIAYDIEGTANATNAATYHCTVTLHEGFSWSDGTKDVVTIDWTIHPKEIEKPTAPSLTYNKGNQVAIESPDEAMVFTGLGEGNNCTNATDAGSYFYVVGLKSANYVWTDAEEGHEHDQVRVEWMIAPIRITLPVLYENLAYNGQYQSAFDTDQLDEDACEFSDDSTYDARDAGNYNFTLILKNTDTVKNYVWWINDAETFADQTLYWSIAQAPNEIKDLKLVGWKVGGAPNAPSCTATWGQDTVTYRYAKDEFAVEEDWSTEPPNEAGNWFVWAHVDATDNWKAADAKLMFTLWDNPAEIFSDTMTITIVNDAGQSFTNYPLALTFAENVPPGFTYARAGETGKALVFISDAGTMLPYRIDTWSTIGESKVTVFIDTLPVAVMTNKMYWCLLEGQSVPAQPAPPASPAPFDSRVTSAYGTVERNGKKVDAWMPVPTMSPTLWNEGEVPTITFNAYALKSGAAVSAGFYDIYDPSVTNTDLSLIPTLPSGSYSMIFVGEDRDDYEPISHTIPFAVVGHSPTIDITGNKGDSGRVLLMNNDTGDVTHPAIDYQGWYDADASNPSGAKKSDTSTFWQFLNQEAVSTFNLKAGTESILWTQNYGRKLWHLKDCRHGNTYETGDTKSTPTMNNGQNYLSWSSTSRRITEHRTSQRAANPSEVGQAVMRNILDAAVYSPVYTNDVGTIYFDAVNGWTTINGEGGENYYQIVVEVATETLDGQPLTEESSHSKDGVYDYLNIKEWKPLTMHPVHVKGSTLTPRVPTEKCGLDVTTGGAKDEFYRIYVPVPEEIGKRPMRFRIRRVSYNSDWSSFPDDISLILLDNILVSYPAMTANVTTEGKYDDKRRAEQVLGWEGAAATPYPSVNGGRIYGLGKLSYYVNDGNPNADPTKFVREVTMHYRWRHLDQMNADQKPFDQVKLDPHREDLRALDPFELPQQTGDVEYWFETRYEAPYYGYKDYSGCGLETQFATIYTEEKTTAVGVYEGEYGWDLPSCGTNWFFRLRRGADAYRAADLVVRRGDSEEEEHIPMTIVADRTWRGFLQTPAGAFDKATVRIFAETSDGGVDVFTGARDELELKDIPFTGAAKRWTSGAGTRVPVDAATGYLMFTFNDEKMTFSVTRADRQDFNLWSSAHYTYFVGNASDTNYVSATIGETNLDFFAKSWAPSVAGNPLWTERFQLSAGQSTAGFEKGVPFISSTTPAGWLAEHAMYTYGQYAVEKTLGDKFALQLEGCGNGSLTFQNAAKPPEGLDTVILHARLAQFYQFNDYAWNYESFGHTNMTLVCRAAFDEEATKKSNSYQGEPAVSLIAHYRPGLGFYEARFTRKNEQDLKLTIYRWRVSGASYETVKLLETDDGWAQWKPNAGDTNNVNMALVNLDNRTTHTGVFITTKTGADGRILVLAGLSMSKLSGSSTGFNEQKFKVAGVWDGESAKLLKSGTFGMGTRDCPGVVLNPVLYLPATVGTGTGVPTTDNTDCNDLIDGTAASFKANDEVKVSFTGASREYNDFDREENWYIPGGRLEPLENHPNCYGLQAVTDLPQTLNVQIRDAGSGNWTTVTNVSVIGFKRTGYVLPVRSVKRCDVRLATVGSSLDTRVDVTIDDISFTQWCGQSNVDYSGTSGMPGDFVYTDAWVEETVTEAKAERVLKLQPTRAHTNSSPVSLRSPLLKGFGMFSFGWRDADAHAKLVFQVASNNVGTATLRTRTTEGPKSANWQEICTIDFSKMSAERRASGATNFYLNVRAPATGVLRVVVDADVVDAALRPENRVDVNWGSVTVTSAFVRDMPAFDYRSWTGWNFRTTGWEVQSASGGRPDPYANLWDYPNGLSAILNRTADPKDPTADLIDDPKKREEYRFNPPYVQTPTMFTNCIGEVSFEARLYDQTGYDPSVTTSYITVWGCTSGDISEASSWKRVESVEVKSPYFRTYTVKAPASETFRAVRLGVSGAPGVVGWGQPAVPPPARVVIDSVVVTEQMKPSVSFRNLFVRPFRDFEAQKDNRIVEGIETTEQQPMLGETFGFQAEIEISETSDDDIDRSSLSVELWYYPKAEPWGYENWKDRDGVEHAVLAPATGTNLIFRSAHSAPGSYAPPQTLEQGEVAKLVQYHMVLSYKTKTGDFYTEPLSARCWTMPSWYVGYDDPNAKPGANFSAFTLLEELMPHRVWFNEIQYRETVPEKSLANQWIELAVPQGVELKGWEIRVYDYTTGYLGILARLGNGVPSSKSSTHAVNRYDFLVLKSPSATQPEADGSWTALNVGTIGSGRLAYTEPYGFELVRPSGVIEHQVVVDGDNPWEDYWFGVQYSGTNLVRVLKEEYGGDWHFAGNDGNFDQKSVSAVTNAPRETAHWQTPLDETPGRINGGQTIDPEWLTEPNGETVWIYANLGSAHVRQFIEGVEQPAGARLIVQKGEDVAIEYRTDRWWALTNVTVNGESRRTTGGTGAVGSERAWNVKLVNVQGRTEVTATPLPDAKVLADPNGSYAPAIMRWLSTGVVGGADGAGHPFVGSEIQKMYYRGNGGNHDEIDLTGMYWLDVDPTDGNWELWGNMGDAPFAPGTLGQVNCSTNRTIRLASGADFTHTNRLTTVWMMITNTVTGEAYAPYRLQGLGGEQSDNFSGSWTSANFKVTMALLNGKVDNIFRPMRYFVFGPDSFRKADDPVSPFAARIEITDPFSQQSPAVDWGWWRYPMDFLPTGWSLDKRVTPGGVSTLKKDDFLEF